MKRVCNPMKIAACAAVLLACGCAQNRIEEVPVKKGEIVGGYVVVPEETRAAQVKQQRAIAKKQEEELRKQQNEINDLRRQQFQNERLKEYIDRTHADAPSN